MPRFLESCFAVCRDLSTEQLSRALNLRLSLSHSKPGVGITGVPAFAGLRREWEFEIARVRKSKVGRIDGELHIPPTSTVNDSEHLCTRRRL